MSLYKEVCFISFLAVSNEVTPIEKVFESHFGPMAEGSLKLPDFEILRLPKEVPDAEQDEVGIQRVSLAAQGILPVKEAAA